MNDSELNELLRRARLPEHPDDYWKDFPGDTLRRLRSSVSLSGTGNRTMDKAATDRAGVKSFAVWLFGCATACVLAGFILGHWHAQREARHNEIAEVRKLFSELTAMFPDQIEAVIFDERGPRLVLGERPAPRKGSPIFVRICSTKNCERIVTFSGQRVRLNGQSCEVLLDARGNIIVAGERFAWSSNERATQTGGFRIEATPLAAL